MTRRPDIQGLRAFAVAAVVVFHLWPHLLPGGFTGVDIFFVISGFLMTSTLMSSIRAVADHPEASPRTGFRVWLDVSLDFYARRIKRIFPAMTVVLLAVLVAVSFLSQSDVQHRTALHVLASMLFVQNWQLVREASNYMAPSGLPSPVQHFWSLSVEEQFYLAWPLLLALVAATMLLAHRQAHTTRRALQTVVGLVTIGSFLHCVSATQADQATAYFSTLSRFWELSMGGLIALAPALPAKAKHLALVAGTAVCGTTLLWTVDELFPGPLALAPVAGAAAILWSGVGGEPRTILGSLLRWHPIQHLGDMSYSLYLWHWPLITLAPLLFGLNVRGEHGTALLLGILVISLVLADLSYRFVEKPALRTRPRRRIVFALAALVMLVVATGSLRLKHHAETRLVGMQTTTVHVAGDRPGPCVGARALTIGKTCADPFSGWSPAAAERAKATPHWVSVRHPDRTCSANVDPPVPVCVLGDVSSTTQIAVWGDSHAEQYLNTFDEIGLDDHVRIRMFVPGACSIEVLDRRCALTLQRLTDEGQLATSKAIIVSIHAGGGMPRGAPVLQWLREAAPETPLFLLQDSPLADADSGPDCGATGLSCRTPRSTALAASETFIRDLVNGGAVNPESVIRTDDLFCDARWCHAYIGGISVYHDTDFIHNSHISAEYAVSLAGILQAKLRAKGILE